MNKGVEASPGMSENDLQPRFLNPPPELFKDFVETVLTVCLGTEASAQTERQESERFFRSPAASGRRAACNREEPLTS